MSIGGRNLIHQNNDLSGYENLIGAVIREGMGWSDKWKVKCVERNGRYRKLGEKKLHLPEAYFTTPEWILGEDGKWWVSLGGLDAEYIYERSHV